MKATALKNLARWRKTIGPKLLDIHGMGKGAKSICDNLFGTLDLRQRHANSAEIRISRDRVLEAAQKGRNIVVFLVLTAIFLPTAFMATFFAIDIFEFPCVKGWTELHLEFVPKNVFSIVLAVLVPLIVMAYDFHNIEGWLTSL
jgi:hypothetical protein